MPSLIEPTCGHNHFDERIKTTLGNYGNYFENYFAYIKASFYVAKIRASVSM